MTNNLVSKATTKTLFHHKHFLWLIVQVHEAIPFIEEVGIFQKEDFVLVVFGILINVIQITAVDGYISNHVFENGKASFGWLLLQIDCLTRAVNIHLYLQIAFYVFLVFWHFKPGWVDHDQIAVAASCQNSLLRLQSRHKTLSALIWFYDFSIGTHQHDWESGWIVLWSVALKSIVF